MSNLHMYPSDETLMAYADGELDERAAEVVERALAADPDLVRRLVDFVKSRRLARNQFASGEAAVPEALRRSLAQLIEAADAAATFSPPIARRPWRGFAMAAAMGGIAVLAGMTGYLSATSVSGSRETALSRIETPGIAAVLSSAASGSEQDIDGGNIRPLATYRLSGGKICRDFIVALDATSVEAVACREGAAWRVLAAVEDIENNDYAPASGESLIDQYLDRLKAGEPLSMEAEEKTLPMPKSGAS